MTGSLVTRFVLQDFLAAAAHSYAASAPEQGLAGRLLLLGETSQVLEGWRSWTDAVRLYADVTYRPEWDAAAARTAAQFGVAIEQEFPGDLIPLPAGAEQRHRPVRDLPDSGLSLWHFDPYSVVFRHVARGDEPDYHIVLAYMKYGWIEREEMDERLTALLPEFSMETIAQDPAEFRRKYKGLLQMGERLEPGTVHRPF